ncbi:MAG: hypothetical protein GY749_17740 [Desulfobacteraceae bacterium]|nr:hypothetical protein [Desulfobacteraceae bacterium]
MANKKLSLIMIITSISVLSIFSFYDYFKEKTRLIMDFNKTIAPVSDRMSYYLPRALWAVNTPQADKMIENEMKMKKIYAVVVREHDKKIFSARQRDENWNIIESDGNISGDFVVKTADIRYDKHLVGTLELYFTTRFIAESLRKLTIEILIKILILTLAIAGTLIHITNIYWKAYSERIEFPPEHRQAGIAILDYFGTVLRKKYPDTKATVSIKQEHMKLIMVIDPAEGEGEIIEKALDEYREDDA